MITVPAVRVKKRYLNRNALVPGYHSWNSMIGRCTNPNSRSYSDYGGKGIKICPQWMKGFKYFFADMGERPKGKTLDRINNDGHYEPGNCRWATPKEQAANRFCTSMATIEGITKPVVEWSAEYGLGRGLIRERMSRGITGTALLAPSKKASHCQGVPQK